MARPELKQFGELEPEDFERHPVWVGCHTADYGKPWYESTDEETFRPWTGKLPADFSEGMLLVKVTFELRDGARYAGFVTPSDKSDDLGTQQPQLFVGDQRFSFWGGMIGIPGGTQQALYTALNKGPEQIFPLRFSGSPELATGVMTGQIDGFYLGVRARVEVEAPERQLQIPTTGAKWFRMQANAVHGYPQPTRDFKFAKLYYQNSCPRCGIYDHQVAPFRFSQSDQHPLSGFLQLHWISDAFFVRRDIAAEIEKAGITGMSFGPALDHRTGTELEDRVQLLIATVVCCAEISRLPTVTCQPDNEEVTEMRRRWPLPPRNEPETADPPNWWGGTKSSYVQYKKKVERERLRIAALPYCGRAKYHPPTSLAITPASLDDAPDLCQSAEWFGSGGEAFRLTLVSEGFAALVREKKWKGLMFTAVPQHGFSERRELKFQIRQGDH